MAAVTRLSSRLAARTGTRQLDVLARADAAADAADRAVLGVWRELLAVLEQPLNFGQRWAHVRALLHRLYVTAHGTLRDHLAGLVRYGHQTAAGVLSQTLPVEVLRAAAGPGALREAAPGLARLTVHGGRFRTRDQAASLREPARAKLSDAEQRRRFNALLFPPPSEQQVQAILRQPVRGRSWEQDLSQASRLSGFDPERMAGTIAHAFALGKPPREIAKDLLPVVGGVKTSARRIARTYGMQVAHHAQMQAHAALDDLIIGWQVHALLDQWTRPEHRARNGTIYYKTPQAGQKGLDDMPSPPLEADGSMAWH